MLDEIVLSKALNEIGYRRVGQDVYRADWSTEVEHLIFVHVYEIFLAAHFGMREKEAHAFAVKSIERYGGYLYQLGPRDDPFFCPMRFSIGGLASWGIRQSLTIPSMPASALADRIRRDIETKLFPFIRHVMRSDQLLQLLLSDEEPYPWSRCNGAIRAAIIVNLAQRMGVPAEEVLAWLEPYFKQIAPHLFRAPDPRPDAYVRRIIEDGFSNSALAQ